MKLVIAALGLAAAGAVGCASTPVPAAQVASAETTLRGAREAGADRVPEANRHLQMADDQLGQAKKLIKKGDNDKAAALLARSQSDAALATGLTQEAQQAAARDAANQRVRAMS